MNCSGPLPLAVLFRSALVCSGSALARRGIRRASGGGPRGCALFSCPGLLHRAGFGTFRDGLIITGLFATGLRPNGLPAAIRTTGAILGDKTPMAVKR